MQRFLLALGLLAFAGASQAAEWRVNRVSAPARVTAIKVPSRQTQVNAGGLWYKIVLTGEKISLVFVDAPRRNPSFPTARCPTAKSPPAKARSRAFGWPSR